MTPVLKIITDYCTQYVDDDRLETLSVTDSALWAWSMWKFLKVGISLCTKPYELMAYLLGTPDEPHIVEPKFDTVSYTTAQAYTEDITVELGEEYAGYEVCVCRMRSINSGGVVSLIPMPCFYDAQTGSVRISVSEDEVIPKGTTFEFDFYTDGYFTENLSWDVCDILGTAFQVSWQNRFNTDWLSLVVKIEDKSFYEQNRANKENADTTRLNELNKVLAGKLRAWEQNLYYKNTVFNRPTV